MALLGVESQEELLGKNVLDFVHPDFRDRSRGRINAVETQGDTAPLIYTNLLHMNGTAIDVELTTARFEYHGKPSLYTIVRDITEQVAARAALQRCPARTRSVR
jgi:PAS domain S-box-containing protein